MLFELVPSALSDASLRERRTETYVQIDLWHRSHMIEARAKSSSESESETMKMVGSATATGCVSCPYAWQQQVRQLELTSPFTVLCQSDCAATARYPGAN